MAEPESAGSLEPMGIPYLPFDTFKGFVDGLSGGRPLPPRIDRSLMRGMAGGTQTLLLGALTTFELIGEHREVTARLVELVRASEEQRPVLMASILHRLYPAQLQLAEQHATADQLAESFRQQSGYQGSTLRKAITFFLNMARYAEVPVSPFFRAPAQTGGTKARGPGRPRTVVAPAPSVAGAATAAGPAESQTVELSSGGTVTISCSVSFLGLNRDDRMFVFDLVDRLLEYRESNQGSRVNASVARADDACLPGSTEQTAV